MEGTIKLNEPFNLYLSNPAISRSSLVSLRRGPNHLKYHSTKKPSKAMSIGTALHTAILEPNTFKDRYVIAPEGLSFATKEGKSFKASVTGKEILKAEDYERVNSMATSVLTHAQAGLLAGISEASLYWKINGVDVKGRPDLINDKELIVLDLKTTNTLALRKLGYKVKDYGYDLQAAMCISGVESCLGWIPKAFISVWIESNPPYDVLFTKYKPEDIYKANEEVENLIEQYKLCTANDYWPSNQSKEVVDLDINFIENEEPDLEDMYQVMGV